MTFKHYNPYRHVCCYLCDHPFPSHHHHHLSLTTTANIVVHNVGSGQPRLSLSSPYLLSPHTRHHVTQAARQRGSRSADDQVEHPYHGRGRATGNGEQPCHRHRPSLTTFAARQWCHTYARSEQAQCHAAYVVSSPPPSVIAPLTSFAATPTSGMVSNQPHRHLPTPLTSFPASTSVSTRATRTRVVNEHSAMLHMW